MFLAVENNFIMKLWLEFRFNEELLQVEQITVQALMQLEKQPQI